MKYFFPSSRAQVERLTDSYTLNIITCGLSQGGAFEGLIKKHFCGALPSIEFSQGNGNQKKSNNV
jgi:hypothetical protein